MPPLDKFISVSFRRTFLKLDDLPFETDINAYNMRTFHPKSGFNLISYMNESVNLLEPRRQQYITRYHLIDKYHTYSYLQNGLKMENNVDFQVEKELRKQDSEIAREDLGMLIKYLY
jgi:hypothetical protein